MAQFLSDVADIAPPPMRERQGSATPGFVLPAATSPEEAERKKAKAEPFWSQVVATPMGQPVSTPPASARRITRKRARRHRIRWVVLVVAILALAIIGLAVTLVITYPELLPGK